jgi:hypothetical protein
MDKKFNLVIDLKPRFSRDDFEIITEQSNSSEPRILKIKGPYAESYDERSIELGNAKANRNGRIYKTNEAREQVKLYTENSINTKTSYQALEHPPTTEVSLKTACAYILNLREEENSKSGSTLYIGESRVLTETPKGKILKGIINGGGGFGVSTRALGKIDESSRGAIVSDFQLVAMDVVASPSCHSAFVKGILESKGRILEFDETREVINAYNDLEKALEKLPKDSNEKTQYLFESVLRFINQLV